MGIATAIIATGIAVTTALGPEKRGRKFEHAVAGAVVVSEKDLEAGDDRSETAKTAQIIEDVEVIREK